MSYTFRNVYKLKNKNSIHWFPGHMGKGLKQMQQKLKQVDCIVEVHDARIPFSGRNVEFKHTISGIKPHILVLNKFDLANKKSLNKLTEQIQQEEGINAILYTNCKDQTCNGIKKLMPTARDLILNSNRYNRSETQDYCIMVIGVPNVGKSSLLNIMRNRYLNEKSVAAVGAKAGITRSVLNKIKISQNPLIYMIDTPGILAPKIKDEEMGMKLALCGCFQDHLVGEETIADYLLFWLNKHENYKYLDLMGMRIPSDDISEVLVAGARKFHKFKKLKHYDTNETVLIPDILYSAQLMIKSFRTGYFGRMLLDKS